MAAVLRVKRRSDEEPLDALVLACKRRKQCAEDSKETDNPFAAVVKFATTVQTQENDISLLLPVNDREDIWKTKLRHKVDIQKKIREQRKQLSETSRFKVVNCYRHVGSAEAGEKEIEEKDVIVFDIEIPDEEKNDAKGAHHDDTPYVYDIYYGHTNNEYDFSSLDHLVDIMPYSSFDFGSSADNASDEETVMDDDDDSNDENNWRNDYPDSDHSINEDDMRLAMQMGDMNLDGGDDRSSSDDDSALIYGIESDPQDVEHYGELYAKYKARVQRAFNEEMASSDENENSSGESGDADSDEDEDPILRFM